jgi:hypothetical protein
VRKLAPLVLLALICACGSGTGQTETVIVATQTVVDTVTQTSQAAPAPLATPTFKLPSGNIGCAFGEGVLVCDVLSGLKPEPPVQCELDWVGVELETRGPASPRCAGDTAFDQSAPVLAYGETWASDGIACSSAKSGLTCRNRDKRGFSLARDAWRAT